MHKLNLKLTEIDLLRQIKTSLCTNQLSSAQRDFLTDLTEQIINIQELSSPIPVTEFGISRSDDKKHLQAWQILFENIPGWDFCPNCYFVEDEKLLIKNIIMIVIFSPSYVYNCNVRNIGFKINLKGDGTAHFGFPKSKDSEQFPELKSFNGTWKDAYLLLIETLKKGWHREDFPKELEQFLPK